MVKKKELVRLASGVYMKWTVNPIFPDACEVAATKAKAFGRELVMCGKHAAQKLGLTYETPSEPIFVTNGRTTSFNFLDGRIHFKGLGPKNTRLADTVAGLVIRAMRYMGNKKEARGHFYQVISNIGRMNRLSLIDSVGMMPAWMSDALLSLKV
jgi:hypothetical protein